jgi:hypothetical protein
MAAACSGIMAGGATTNGAGGARITLNGAIGINIAAGTTAGAVTASGMRGMRIVVTVGTVIITDTMREKRITGATTVTRQTL